MERVPLREDIVHQLCGLPVCVVMNDGTRHVGILSSCEGGRLVLNAHLGGEEAKLAKVQPQDKKKKKGGKGKKEEHASEGQAQAQTQAYPYDPYGYGGYYPWGGALALDFALIALLFLLI
ncbi:hypothetical protein [Paenibacillus arenilitoris]|uniref:Uncharacterized protein n=1 Tax=Paenibacillus arenilitoris TaxID=2772299 RepID=A0A927CJP3_9BACL|nr:hypothetical protein [Paenibacillus arenilitoris]MBD2867848.1 hypothetical protein [Paenibacillus arenilitoris]